MSIAQDKYKIQRRAVTKLWEQTHKLTDDEYAKLIEQRKRARTKPGRPRKVRTNLVQS